MALVTISGFPCSGKSRRAQQIQLYIQERIHDPAYNGPLRVVTVLSDHTLGISRMAYDESRSEKPARGALFTALQRQMSQDKVLIIDAMNYIKGFRYQIYCTGREMKLRMCTVRYMLLQLMNYVEAGILTAPTTKDIQQKRLLRRHEEPSSMVRWDSPLFTVLWSDQDIPGAQIWEAITEGVVKPPNSGTLAVAKAPTNALHTLEQTTTAMVSFIMEAQLTLQGTGGTVTLPLSPTAKPQVIIPSRNITLSEIQRLKRQFITVHKKAITLGTTEKGSVDWSEESVAHKFADYLQEHLKC